MHTNTFNNAPFYSNDASARFAQTTNDTGEVVAPAVRLGERLWRDGFRYSKCGVMITELLPETIRQPALWGELDSDRREQTWKVLDKLNATLGRDTVRILGAGLKNAAWKLKAQHRSSRWSGDSMQDEKGIWRIVEYAHPTSPGKLASHNLRRPYAKLCRKASRALGQT